MTASETAPPTQLDVEIGGVRVCWHPDSGLYAVGGTTAPTLAALRLAVHEAEAARKDAAMRRAARQGQPTPVTVIADEQRRLVGGLYRGRDQRSGMALLTIDGEKVSQGHHSVLAALTAAEMAEGTALLDEWWRLARAVPKGRSPMSVRATYIDDEAARAARKAARVVGPVSVLRPGTIMFRAISHGQPLGWLDSYVHGEAVTLTVQARSDGTLAALLDGAEVATSDDGVDRLTLAVAAALHPEKGRLAVAVSDGTGRLVTFDGNPLSTARFDLDLDEWRAATAAADAARDAWERFKAAHRFAPPPEAAER